MRNIVANHYNKQFNTDEYIVYADDCYETDNGYFMILRTTKEDNAWVYYVMVDTTTGRAYNDLQQEWNLFDE